MRTQGTTVVEALDRTGSAASRLCAIHCALMPLVITLLPLMGLGFLAHQTTEWALVGVSATLGITSLCWGYRSHGSTRALKYLGIGLGLVAVGRVLESQRLTAPGVVALVLGGFTIAFSHKINSGLCRQCRACHPEVTHQARNLQDC